MKIVTYLGRIENVNTTPTNHEYLLQYQVSNTTSACKFAIYHLFNGLYNIRTSEIDIHISLQPGDDGGASDENCHLSR